MIGDRSANAANDRRVSCWTLDDVIVSTGRHQKYAHIGDVTVLVWYQR